jgi:hypothetical protein
MHGRVGKGLHGDSQASGEGCARCGITAYVALQNANPTSINKSRPNVQRESIINIMMKLWTSLTKQTNSPPPLVVTLKNTHPPYTRSSMQVLEIINAGGRQTSPPSQGETPRMQANKARITTRPPILCLAPRMQKREWKER